MNRFGGGKLTLDDNGNDKRIERMRSGAQAAIRKRLAKYLTATSVGLVSLSGAFIVLQAHQKDLAPIEFPATRTRDGFPTSSPPRLQREKADSLWPRRLGKLTRTNEIKVAAATSLSDGEERIIAFDYADWRDGAARHELGAHEIVATLTVERGDTLGDVLSDAGLSSEEAAKAVAVLQRVFPAKALKAGQKVNVQLKVPPSFGLTRPKPRLQKLSLARSLTQIVMLARSQAQGFTVDTIEKPLSVRRVRAGGEIRSSLYEAASRIGLPSSLIAEMIKAYSYDVDFQRDIRRGDPFEVVYEQLETPEGEHVGSGKMLYAMLSLSGEALPIYYFEHDGSGEYFKPNGEAVKKSLLQTPIDGARITSGFGMRLHPLLGYSKMHKGVDFGAATGTPIFAAGNGTIIEIGNKGGYGKYVKIRHDGTYATAYGHCSRFAAGLRVGTKVKQGDVIAYVGATGAATGPHLHYEIVVNGKQVNPKSIKEIGGNRLAGSELKKFQAAIAALDDFRRQPRSGRQQVAIDPDAIPSSCPPGEDCEN